jgi:tetratricopeptide repeat protein 21B
MLKNVPSDSIYYTRCKMKMADIYLKYKKNRKQYAACYDELAMSGNSVHTFILLGEAYMKIQEPERAIAAYEQALRLNPEDASLASKIGRALVTTHDYVRAVKYYETAARGDPSKVYLVHELAELYLQQRNYEQAVKVLTAALIHPDQKVAIDTEDTKSMQSDVKSHMMLAEVYKGGNVPESHRTSLQAALDMQMQVLAKQR